MAVQVICPYCQKPAKLVTGREIYPHRGDLYQLRFWQCPPCDAYVGCHKANRKHGLKGQEPLGRLANAELRAAKSAAHREFDPLWKDGYMDRGQAYAWLSEALGIPKGSCHIGMFDVPDCLRVVQAVQNYWLETL